MASDEELARRVAQVETNRDGKSRPLDSHDLEEFRGTASEVHDELARRIERVDDRAVDEDALASVLDRLERLESRLDELEERR